MAGEGDMINARVSPCLTAAALGTPTTKPYNAIICLLQHTATITSSSPCYRVRDLDNNRLSGTIPNSLGSANSLTTLYV